MTRMEQFEALSEARAQVPAAARDFFDAFTQGADMGGLCAADIAFAVLRARAEIEALGSAPSRVALADGEESSFLIAVNEDRPFLFDSALAAAIAGGGEIKGVFHPILAMGGRKLSVIVFVLEKTPPDTRLAALLEEAFAAGAAAVRDWKPMLARLRTARDGLAARPPRGQDIEEDLAFLDWLADDHFTFLGARAYRLTADGAHGTLEPLEESGLGVLADTSARVLASGGARRTGLSAEVRAFLEGDGPLIVTKSSVRSVVHRRVHMDYIGVKTYDADGAFNGEHRFVGLFTSGAYSQSPRVIPLLRRKIASVTARAGIDPQSHDGKALAHILDTFPRDELFQIPEEELFDTALGIARLTGLPRTRLFLRFDRFDRFVSALVYAPRDRMTPEARLRVHRLLAEALGGRTSAADEAVGEGPLLRVHYIIGRNEGPRPPVDIAALERQVAAALETWDDGLVKALSALHGPGKGRLLATKRAAHFPPGYRDAFPPHDGARDLEILSALTGESLPLRVRAYRRAGDAATVIRLKLYGLGPLLPLSNTLPLFENCGLKVIAEDSFPVSFTRDDGTRQEAQVLDFLMERPVPTDLDAVRQGLEDVLHAVLRGLIENDGFNRLVLEAGLSWREVLVLRAIAKYLRQAGLSFSLAYMQQALARNPEVAALLVALFLARTDPAGAAASVPVRIVEDRIAAALKDVQSLDDDRIIRRMRNVIRNVLRTNYFQEAPGGGPGTLLSFKLDSGKLDELPAPRPWREIFVYAPEVEGVHLRFGRIARGGIRWSDRREDFRTEILGLVKAQQVKNAVIVPVGAKGGFVPKKMPANPTREEFLAAGIAAYKTFIGALLDITDNLDADGQVVPPPGMLRPDGDDPYLVVAADKGTATFSDIANAIAVARGFWLHDAFASGGSKGYDHKKMGITARGAWEAIKRHFRELGTDIQKEDFTVIGVGDMSGDVFGNGMLLSRHIRLIAAFDHRHIFLDPAPDAETSYRERARLFALPRSSWDDYDKSLISKGGGVFARSLKEIRLTEEIKAMIGTEKEALSPAELIHALLKARTDLLWFGGIGTYIKATSQSHAEVGDRANDAVRVNGAEVQARVVGEGANLGVTQPGRIEYARGGGRIDTDAVDNSAGVDTSDHEVNLKILLSGPVRRGELSEEARDALLAAMTDDVARLVLEDNYNQTLALSVAESRASAELDGDARLIADLEARGRLERAVEYLPSDAELKRLHHEGRGLTRPELAVLLAYAKLDLDAELLESDLPEDSALGDLLTGYFPKAAVEAFPEEPGRHRLKKEIVSTVLTNRVVNLAGPVFVLRMRELSGKTATDAARAFVIADGAFGLSALKARIDALDGTVKAAAQVRAYAAIALHAERVAPWFLARGETDIAAAIALYRDGVDALRETLARDLSPDPELPGDVARDVALLPRLAAALDMARLAADTGADIATVAALYEGVGETLGLERLHALAARLVLPDHWDRLALRRLLDDLSGAQGALSARLLKAGGLAALDAWRQAQQGQLTRMRAFLEALETSGEPSVAKLMLLSSQIQGFS